MWQKELKDVPGIGAKITQLNNGTYSNIARKIIRITDLTKEDLKYLPKESMLAIKYLDGNNYSRSEIKALEPILAELFPNFTFAGSYRREKQILNDADILVLNYFPNTIKQTNSIKVVKFGAHKARLLIKPQNRFIPVDVAFIDKESWPAALLHYTGSKEFNIHMRKLAQKLGYKLNEYGLFKNGIKAAISSEKDIFAALNLEYLPANMRK